MNTTEQTKSKPEQLPPPTYAPFFLAMGVTFIVWGLISSRIISAAGVIVSSIALYKWIGAWLKENGNGQ